ncbi:class I SAM-dependent methyltransferase [Geodermatophilus sp. URMC 62]|uniref:class I SAM-dependent methyltransferase n=1 Tax=Geodermatophilus sp. URMC 62 TaxID=3423414 RepID=UPI00406C3741
MVRPADFYTGIVADLYHLLKSVSPDPEPYARFIRRHGEPALELGCGDGEPLLDLRRRGLAVQGVDSSADMLQRCRRAAARAGLDVVLHHQRMEALALPERYRSIFLAGPTFTLLPDDEAALLALRAIRAHLAAGGAALVPLFVPAPTPEHSWRQVREVRAEDGALLRFSVVSEERDESNRTQRAVLRYERHTAGESTVVDRTWTLHWHTQAGFRDLAAAAGLRTAAVRDGTGRRVRADASSFAFVLERGGGGTP